MNKLPIERVKRRATDKELALYEYITQEVEATAQDIYRRIMENDVDEGELIFVDGPVYSGKSILACSLISKLEKNNLGREFTAAQPDVDRPDVSKGEIYSRNGMTCPALAVGTKREIEDMFHRFSIVIFDEVHFIPYEFQSFFLKEAEQFVERGGWLINLGLIYTSHQTEFLLASILQSRSNHTYHLIATCQMCGRKGASRNQRLINGRAASNKEPDLQPPSEKVTYEPRCEDCLVR